MYGQRPRSNSTPFQQGMEVEYDEEHFVRPPSGMSSFRSNNYPNDYDESLPGQMMGGSHSQHHSQHHSHQRMKEDKYRHEKNAINDAQSVAYTAYTMNQDSDIVQQLRNVGVTVLSLESLSTSAMINYMDAVTTMRLGNGNDEKCMLYTDRMGRVFNVIISGGAEGLEKAWSVTKASFSGWVAITVLPFLLRNMISYTFDGYANNSPMALDPLFLLFIFGFVLQHETSNSIVAMSLFVRGTNSVGSFVWRGGSLTDYPRYMVLFILALASFASPNYPVRDILSLVGSAFGCGLILCNLGSRAWNKVDIGFIDASNIFTPLLTVLVSLLSGILFPYVGLRFVDGGTDAHDDEAAVENIMFNPNGKRARQNVTATASVVALVFLLSDAQIIQDVLGFHFSEERGITNIVVGVWWFLSTLISMSLCHRLDSSNSKKIEPFLKRDETSPVGWIVPSVPNIVIDPNLGRGKMVLSFLSFGSDVLCALIAAGLSFLIVWIGIKDLQGTYNGSFWDYWGSFL